jgi:uncharacterized protein involved in outer membrane biogenesis
LRQAGETGIHQQRSHTAQRFSDSTFMADATLVTPTPKKRRGWLRAIVWVLGMLIVLVVVAYFVATSSAFFKSVILPRVGKAMNAEVTVNDASISPFSQVILHNLKVQPTGAEPLMTAPEVRLRYSLIDIIRGNIRVDEAVLDSPTVTLVEQADGSRNLDPLLKGLPQTAPEKQPAAPSKPPAAKPPQIDVKKVALKDATLSRVKNYANGTRDVVEISHVNLTLDDLKNGQTGKLALGADISVQQTNATLQGKLAGTFTISLAADLKPASVKGSARLDVTKAEGALVDAAALGAELNVEVTPTDLKEVALRFQKGNANLGELRVSGPFDIQKREGRLSIMLAGIDKQLLNVVGAKFGMDFGGTTISSTNEVELAKGGSVITAKGQFNVNSFQLTRMNQTTPRLDLRKQYDVTVDRALGVASLRTLAVTGTQNGKTLLKAELTSPMQIPLRNTNIALGDATLSAAITNFNFADWKPFLGDVAPEGMLNLTAKVRSQQGDQQIALALDSRIDHLTVNAGSNHIADATITLRASGKATNLKQFNFTDYRLEVAHQNETLVTASGSGTYDKVSEDADMQLTVQAALAPLLRRLPQPGMTTSSGTFELKAHITQQQKTRAAKGSLALNDFSGAFGTNEMRGLGTAAEFDIGMVSQQVQIRKLAGKLSQSGNAVGSFDVSGTYDSGTTNADVQATMQLALAPLLQVVPRSDVSVSSGTVELKAHATQKQKSQAVAGSLALEGFTGRFGTNELRSLGTAVDFDIGMAAQQVQIRKLAGKLTQAGNAAGTFDFSGTYDPSTTNADLQATAELVLAALAQAAPRADVRVSSGTLGLKARVTQKQNSQAITGSLALADFTGQLGTNEVRGLGTSADFDVGMTAQQAQIRKLTGKLSQGANPGGSFDVSGTYDFVKTNGNLNAKLMDFNQNGLGPFLGSALGDKKLVSVVINASAAAQYDPQGASSVKADLQMTNLVVKDPAGQFPATPLEAKLLVDASLNKQVADVRQFVITLTPTARATNQVQLSGQVDMTQTNATQGKLKLVADSLDFTSYYDLFMGAKQAPATRAGTTSAPATRPATAPGAANKEPEAIQLPLHNFTAEAAIRRLYLREVEIDDWQTTVKIDGGHVVLNPFKLTLNGAPVNTTLDLDLGVPGYKYDMSLSALAIPLAPLVNSFQPERKGILSGTLTAQAKLGGAGTTGTGLQKSLTGQFDMASTNLNLSVDNIQGKTFYTRLLKTLVKTIVIIPDLVKNPGGTATAFLQGLTGSSSSPSSNGASVDLAKSPINSIVLRGTAGSGRVDLQKAIVQSPTFEAQASGTVTLAEVLTNSPLQIPVSVSLERSVAQRINMAGNTPTNATYAKLPDFLIMKGTLGNPKPDYMALASVLLQGTGGKAGQAGGALQGLSSLLSGGTNTINSSTNKSGGKASGILQGLGGLLNSGTPSATNAPATNRTPADNLLDGLFGPKKK